MTFCRGSENKYMWLGRIRDQKSPGREELKIREAAAIRSGRKVCFNQCVLCFCVSSFGFYLENEI